MLQILTYMFAFYLLVKGVEILQMALCSSREDRSPMVGLAVLTVIACCISAFAFVKMQDDQAQSLQGIASGALSPANYASDVFEPRSNSAADAEADAAVKAAEQAAAEAEAAANAATADH